mgnify:CR=1 FL=1
MFTKSRKNAEKFSRIITGLLHKSFADEGDGNGGQEPPVIMAMHLRQTLTRKSIFVK